jgi:hypothetical protein
LARCSPLAIPAVTDREDEIPDLKAVAITEWEFRQAVRAHRDDGHVGLRICADTPRRQCADMGDLHRNLVRMKWLLVVMSRWRVEHYAGAEDAGFRLNLAKEFS